MLQISLVDNKLTKDDLHDRMAVVQNLQYRSVEDIVEQITAEGSILKPTESEAVTTAVLRTITKNLREGYGFQSEFFSLVPSVAGVFTDDQDRFDPSRHQVALNLRLSAPMKEALAQTKVEVVPHTTPMPVIHRVFDRKSKTTDEQLTPGYTLEISGERLKITDEAAPEQGVFLINVQRSEEVRVAYFYQNLPKSLHVELPDNLRKGVYQLEVRTTLFKTKDIRTAVLPHRLSVP